MFAKRLAAIDADPVLRKQQFRSWLLNDRPSKIILFRLRPGSPATAWPFELLCDTTCRHQKLHKSPVSSVVMYPLDTIRSSQPSLLRSTKWDPQAQRPISIPAGALRSSKVPSPRFRSSVLPRARRWKRRLISGGCFRPEFILISNPFARGGPHVADQNIHPSVAIVVSPSSRHAGGTQRG